MSVEKHEERKVDSQTEGTQDENNSSDLPINQLKKLKLLKQIEKLERPLILRSTFLGAFLAVAASVILTLTIFYFSKFNENYNLIKDLSAQQQRTLQEKQQELLDAYTETLKALTQAREDLEEIQKKLKESESRSKSAD